MSKGEVESEDEERDYGEVLMPSISTKSGAENANEGKVEGDEKEVREREREKVRISANGAEGPTEAMLDP